MEDFKKTHDDVLFGNVSISSLSDEDLLQLQKGGGYYQMPDYQVFKLAVDEIVIRRESRLRKLTHQGE